VVNSYQKEDSDSIRIGFFGCPFSGEQDKGIDKKMKN